MAKTTTNEANAEHVARVVRHLEEDIIFGRLRQRERLVEDALLERFGVKRHVVRQALMALEKLGIVVRERNKGAMVRGYSTTEVEAIYEMRELLHATAIRRMPLPADASLIEALEGYQAQHADAVERNDLRSVYRLNDTFHHTLFEVCGNPYLYESILHYDGLSYPIRSLRIGDPDLLNKAVADHTTMIELVKAGERDALAKLCVQHMHPSKNAYLSVFGW